MQLESIKKELEEEYRAREKAIGMQRRIIETCARAIRDLHKPDFESAGKKLEDAKALIKETERALEKYPETAERMLSISYQEFAELQILLSYMRERKLPEPKRIGVPSKYYLLGMADAVGELKRQAMEMLASGDVKGAEKLYNELQEIYYEFSTFVFPSSIVPALKMKQDAMRKILNDLHSQIMAQKLRG